MTELTTIPLSRLVRSSKLNIRRTDRATDLDGLTASLEHHGVRQNLTVRPTSRGRFEVIAGGRRLEALKRLHTRGRLPADTPIPCMILAEADDAVEISLAENLVRRPAHPDDEAEAIRLLAERDGLTVETIAARFGTTTTFIRQRLRLAAVSPTLRTLYRQGELDPAQMRAFALVADPVEQERVHRELPDWNHSPDAIRRALTRTALPLTHRLAQFVGEEVYLASGGAILRDLFGDPDQGFMEDAGLLDRLAMARLEREAEFVRAEGWSFVLLEPDPDYSVHYGRLYPVSEGPPPVFTPEDLARAGARLSIAYDGSLSIERGLIRQDPPTRRRAVTSSSDTSPADLLPDKTREDLSAHRTLALRLELARRPDLALATLVHALALQILYPPSHDHGSCLALKASPEDLTPFIQSAGDSLAVAPLDTVHAEWQATLPSDPAQLWDWCREAPIDTLLTLLGVLTSATLNATWTRLVRSDHPRFVDADRLATALDLDLRDHWQPTPGGFPARISKALLSAFVAEAGDADLAAQIPSLKKAEAARRASAAFIAARWLPPPLCAGDAQANQGPSNEADEQRQP